VLNACPQKTFKEAKAALAAEKRENARQAKAKQKELEGHSKGAHKRKRGGGQQAKGRKGGKKQKATQQAASETEDDGSGSSEEGVRDGDVPVDDDSSGVSEEGGEEQVQPSGTATRLGRQVKAPARP